MITSAPNAAQLERWKKLWKEKKDLLVPNRKSGQQLLDYLFALYPLEETADGNILETVSFPVTENEFFIRKLAGGKPVVRAFFVKNEGNGALLYQRRSRIYDEVERIIVGVDVTSGCYYVEGSEQLWDELCAYQGLDQDDLCNFVRTAQYIECMELNRQIIGMKVTVIVDRPLGSTHPNYPDLIYPVNYGFVRGIIAADGEEQDAYILGTECAVDSFTGIVAAIIHRSDDCEEKWVVIPEGAMFSKDEIASSVRFQERFFLSSVIM